MSFLGRIYEEANRHHIETDKKRDQLLGFYAIITGAFLGSFNSIEPIAMRELITIALVIFNLVLVFIFINYRKWHITYVNTALVVQSLALRKRSFTKDNIEKTWDELFVESDYKLGTIDVKKGGKQIPLFTKLIRTTILSVEFMTFNAFLIISSPTIYLLFDKLLEKSIWWTSADLIVKYLGSLAIYLTIVNLFANYILTREFSRKSGLSWLLRTPY